MGRLPKVIAIVGTNASGKSSLGVELAQRYQGEILSADSRQVYRGLNLGSGKITQEEMHGVAHHMIDICNPGDFFSMADFQRLSYQLIDRILSRGNTPFIVGGTGLYIDAVLDGYLLSDKAPDLAYREYLEKQTTPQLYEMLCKAKGSVDVDPKNRNRVMRMLERVHDGDDSLPQEKAGDQPVFMGVSCPRAAVMYLVTEYGIAFLKGKSTWERAEEIINLAHPDFREDLIKAAEKQGLWSQSSKLI